jgi:hypothetical protein
LEKIFAIAENLDFHAKLTGAGNDMVLLLQEPKLLKVKNDIFQIAKKPIRNERLALSELENEFC